MTIRQTAGQLVDQLGAAGITRLKERLGLNTETKIVYDNAGGSLGTSFGAIMSIPTIALGSTPITRVGASLRVVRFKFRVLFSTAATGTSACQVRLFVIIRRKTVLGVAAPANGYLADTTTLLSHPAFAFENKISGVELVFDKTYSLTVLAADKPMVGDSFIVELHDFDMEWTQADTTGALGALLAGDIECYAAYGNNPAAVTTAPTFAIFRETEFVDN